MSSLDIGETLRKIQDKLDDQTLLLNELVQRDEANQQALIAMANHVKRVESLLFPWKWFPRQTTQKRIIESENA